MIEEDNLKQVFTEKLEETGNPNLAMIEALLEACKARGLEPVNNNLLNAEK